MSTSAINSLSNAANTTSTTNNGLSAMTSDQFIKVMMAELSQQDPLQPSDTGKLMDQVSSLRNIQSQIDLQASLKSLTLQQQISSAGNLIGKMIAGRDENNQTITGQVTSVLVQNGKAVLQLDSGKSLTVDRVTQIANATAAATGTTN